MKLRLAEELSFPLDAATQTFLTVGKRGSGKSSTETRFAEQLIYAGIQIAAIDPADVWWGLKAGAHGGRKGGLDVYVFGGRHADLPLEPTAGALMADVLIEHRINAVMVIREFSTRERTQFLTLFAERLFQKNREVIHLFIEEAHELMPQNIMDLGDERKVAVATMLSRMMRLWKLGRTSGIGMSAITQRVASLNKNVTTQAEVLIAHRLIGPQDVDAVDGWIKHHRQQEKRETVLSTLPELKTGEAWVWAPDFPEDHPLGLRRVQIALPDTFDSRRTPKPGEHRREPKQLARVDLEKIRTKMAATIEKAKQDDPRALRAEIARLKYNLQAQVDREMRVKINVVKVPTPVVGPKQERMIVEAVAKLEKAISQLRLVGTKEFVVPEETVALTTPPPGPRRITVLKTRAVGMSTMIANASIEDGKERPVRVGKGEQKVLAAVAQHGESGVTREAVTILTGYKRSSRDTYLQRLISWRFVRQDGKRLFASEAGVAALDPRYEPLPVGSDLREYWMNHLPEGEKKIFATVVAAGGMPVERDVISEATGYKRSSRDTYLQRLRARELILADGTKVRAAPDLF